MEVYIVILLFFCVLNLAIEIQAIEVIKIWKKSPRIQETEDEIEERNRLIESFNSLDTNADENKNKLFIFVGDKGSRTPFTALLNTFSTQEPYTSYTNTILYFVDVGYLDKLNNEKKKKFDNPFPGIAIPIYPVFHFEKNGKPLERYVEFDESQMDELLKENIGKLEHSTVTEEEEDVEVQSCKRITAEEAKCPDLPQDAQKCKDNRCTLKRWFDAACKKLKCFLLKCRSGFCQ